MEGNIRTVLVVGALLVPVVDGHLPGGGGAVLGRGHKLIGGLSPRREGVVVVLACTTIVGVSERASLRANKCMTCLGMGGTNG